MDENYSLLPHGVNFQDAIFADTQDNWRLFSSLFQYSNCSQGQQVMDELESQEDSRVSLIFFFFLIHRLNIPENIQLSFLNAQSHRDFSVHLLNTFRRWSINCSDYYCNNSNIQCAEYSLQLQNQIVFDCKCTIRACLELCYYQRLVVYKKL